MPKTDDLVQEIADLKEENKRLREALEEYGDHDNNCRIWDNQDCDCGYEQALKETK